VSRALGPEASVVTLARKAAGRGPS
jgi:hypothetical protein